MAKEQNFDDNKENFELLPSEIAITEEELRNVISIAPNPYSHSKRPKKYLKWSTIDKLCALKCTLEEIAVKTGVTPDLIERRMRETFNISFKDYFRIKSQLGNVSLRHMQYELAKQGNPTMLIWLGKNWLGQTDKAELSVNGKVDFNVNVNPNLLPAVYRDAKAEIINDS